MEAEESAEHSTVVLAARSQECRVFLDPFRRHLLTVTVRHLIAEATAHAGILQGTLQRMQATRARR